MKKKDDFTFEEGFARAQALVEAMERGELPLDKTFEAYEQAAILLAELNKMLDRGENRIEMLMGGEVVDITCEVDE